MHAYSSTSVQRFLIKYSALDSLLLEITLNVFGGEEKTQELSCQLVQSNMIINSKWHYHFSMSEYKEL